MNTNKIVSVVIIAFALALSGRAEGLSEIQARCIHREIASLEEINRLTYAWEKQAGHVVAFSGTTASMEPAISWWDTIYLQAVAPGDKLVVGEIYIYSASWVKAIADRIPENLHTMGGIHQLVRISGKMCLFRGLNNERYDPWAPRSSVLYVVRRVLGTRVDKYAGGRNP